MGGLIGLALAVLDTVGYVSLDPCPGPAKEKEFRILSRMVSVSLNWRTCKNLYITA